MCSPPPLRRPSDPEPRSVWRTSRYATNSASCVAACEVIYDVLSRIQGASLAGQGHAGTSARASAETGTRGSDTASWRPSSPLRAARSLNVAALAAIPRRNAVPILAGQYDMTIRFPTAAKIFLLLPWSTGTVERAPDLPALCAGRVRSQIGFAIGSVAGSTGQRPGAISMVLCGSAFAESKFRKWIHEVIEHAAKHALTCETCQGSVQRFEFLETGVCGYCIGLTKHVTTLWIPADQ